MAFNIYGMAQEIWHILYFMANKARVKNKVVETSRGREGER